MNSAAHIYLISILYICLAECLPEAHDLDLVNIPEETPGRKRSHLQSTNKKKDVKYKLKLNLALTKKKGIYIKLCENNEEKKILRFYVSLE